MTALLRNVSERERRRLVGVTAVLVVLAILLFVDLPLYNRGTQLGKRAAEEQQRLTSIVSMSREYLSVKAELDETRGTAFNSGGASLAGIDVIVGKSGLKKKLASVKATTKPVAEGIKAVKAEMSLERISLGDLSRLIAFMESGGHPIAIERISVKATHDDPAAFNATLIVNTVERE